MMYSGRVYEILWGKKEDKMRLKWGEEKIKCFNEPVKKAERDNDWAWWCLFGALVVMIAIFIIKVT